MFMSLLSHVTRKVPLSSIGLLPHLIFDAVRVACRGIGVFPAITFEMFQTFQKMGGDFHGPFESSVLPGVKSFIMALIKIAIENEELSEQVQGIAGDYVGYNHASLAPGLYVTADALLRLGVDVNAVDEQDNTLLHWMMRAVALNHTQYIDATSRQLSIQVCSRLIKNGLDLITPNSSGQTAMEIAPHSNYVDAVLKYVDVIAMADAENDVAEELWDPIVPALPSVWPGY
jgi:hypothetical protein